jgi:hypothetical protein
MAGEERKPRARKKKATGDGVAAAGEQKQDAANEAIEANTAPTTPADMASEPEREAPAPKTATRTTIDHMHDSLTARPDTYGEVF